MKFTKTLLASAMVISTLAASAQAFEKVKSYTVTVTNITKGAAFTPVLAVSHNDYMKLYEVGTEASEELEAVAEGGDISGFMTSLSDSVDVTTVETNGGMIMPGQSAEIHVYGTKHDVLSLTSMLLPTNDTILGLDSVKLPNKGSVTYYAGAYDAGTETNDELCESIPGPHCGGSAFSPSDAGEGYVYPAVGIHGEGDLSTMAYGWSGPVAKVVITRTKK